MTGFFGGSGGSAPHTCGHSERPRPVAARVPVTSAFRDRDRDRCPQNEFALCWCMLRAIMVLTVLALSTTTATLAADMSTWEGMTRQRCPHHHLEWTCDGCWDDYLAEFERQLPPPAQRKVMKIADYDHRCWNEVAGLSCEMAVHVDALNRLHLLNRFVDWGCSHYKCEEVAVCGSIRSAGGKH
jgi:hypothetical protein